MLQLHPMTEAEFTAYRAWLVEDYAREVAENYRLPLSEARASALRQIDGLLSQGLFTPNHHLYHIVLQSENSQTRIGYLWLEVNDQKQRCYIADLYLHAEYRRQGWGRRTLELLEADMRQHGITRISLHVFASNQAAQALYRQMGYQPTGLDMQKWLTG